MITVSENYDHILPITFRVGMGETLTYKADKKGIYDDGQISSLSLECAIRSHNKINPENKSDVMWYIAEPQVTGRACRKADLHTECAIEDMPIGAQIISIKRNEDEWDDLKMKVRRIEVHDDTIVLLAHYSMHGVGYGAEMNIKRGTLVRYTKG